MTTLAPYLSEGISAGHSINLEVESFRGWSVVGNGSVTATSDFEIAVDGRIDYLGFKGDLTINLQLTDHSASALSGPCSLQVNDYADPDASYGVEKDGLNIKAVLSGQAIQAKLTLQKGNMTQINVEMGLGITCRIVPQ